MMTSIEQEEVRKGLSVDTSLPTSGKRWNEDRTPNNEGNATKKQSLAEKMRAAATEILEMAAPRTPPEEKRDSFMDRG